MTGWHEGPLAGFDLETTSPDPETARIVTAAVVHWTGSGVAAASTWLVNPGVEIPAEATAVHGVTNEMVQAKGVEPHVASYEISALLAGSVLLSGVPLVIYNAPYDLTVLDRETRRYGQAPFSDVLTGCTGCVVDPFVLDKHLDRYRKGKRTLTASCEHYRVKLDGAHDASYDALAAMRLAWKIAAVNPVVAKMTLTELHDLQVAAKAEQAASFQDYLRKQGSAEVVEQVLAVQAVRGGDPVTPECPQCGSELVTEEYHHTPKRCPSRIRGRHHCYLCLICGHARSERVREIRAALQRGERMRS